MRRAIISAAFLAFTGGLVAVPASAASVKLDYEISFAGFHLGQANLAASFEGRRYATEVRAQLTGLAGLLVGGGGAGHATGFVGGGQPVPSSFVVNSRSARDERTVRMGLSGGSVASVEIVPPLEEHSDRVPVTSAHKRGVVDPISALLMPALSRDASSAANCNRTIPIFDGAARFNIKLSYDETRMVEKPGYKGPVIVCKARYDPVAGHRPERRATKYMEENREMSVWLAPVESARVLVPVRIAVRSMSGLVVIELSRWSQGSTAQAAEAVVEETTHAWAATQQ